MKLSIRSVLFLGVGGISMHQLAIAFKNLGVKVYGYDAKESKYTKICIDNGVKFSTRFEKEFCSVDLCVKTGAIKTSKYLSILKARNCIIIDRAELLSWFCSKFKTVIAVAGTHGKSTTSSLIYEILRTANKKVSCHIGAEVFASRFNIGDEFLVVEACEYNKSFLSLFPNVSVVTNIEAEHMDCYNSLFNLRSAFLTFLKRAQKRYVYLEKSTQFLTKYKNINFVSENKISISPQIKGEYNLKNIALAISVCKDLGVKEKDIICAVNNFRGVARRYELIGNVKNTKIYIDYAHHPTEVKAFINAFTKEYQNCLIVFQPHTYSRTKTFINDFVDVFKGVKNLIIYKEYSARETKDLGLTAKDLYLQIKKYNNKLTYCAKPNKIVEKINNFSAVAFVGAGDINNVAERIIQTN